MSAFYAVAHSDRVDILTDGAMYDDNGVVTDLVTKVWRSETLPIAFAGRGNAAMTQLGIGMMLDVPSVLGSVDRTLALFADALAKQERWHAIPIDGVIGSISDAGQPQLHWFTTYDGFDGFEPLTLYDVAPRWGGAPTPAPETMALFGFPERFTTETPAEYGADLFEAFRRTPMKHLAHPAQPLLYAVGGHVDLTTVRASGCTVERLRTWDADRVGENIDPETNWTLDDVCAWANRASSAAPLPQ